MCAYTLQTSILTSPGSRVKLSYLLPLVVQGQLLQAGLCAAVT